MKLLKCMDDLCSQRVEYMKKQWLLLLAAVGMSLGVLADDCDSDPCSCCYGLDHYGNKQTESIDKYCTVDHLQQACWLTEYAYVYEDEGADSPFPCGLSFVTFDICYGDYCSWCQQGDDYDSEESPPSSEPPPSE
jgi:hypothetical protein